MIPHTDEFFDPPHKRKPVLKVNKKNQFLLDRYQAFSPYMDKKALTAFFEKYKINYPKEPFVFWTFCYVSVLTGQLGEEGTKVRASIWLKSQQIPYIAESRTHDFCWDAKRGFFVIDNQHYFIPENLK
jgi:hypothetical protein